MKRPSLSDTQLAALALSFVLVFPKKWEPGGNIDTIWYAAIARNLAETRDFFHFYISKYYLADLYDHLPLTYWVTGGMFSVWGISDFVARIYPMMASFASCLLVYAIGSLVRGGRFGLTALLAYALCFGAMKWNGSLLHDVPLTAYFLATTYCFLRAVANPRSRVWFIPAALFFGLGALTKGPIIFGFALGAALWLTWENRWRDILSREFLYGILTLGIVLGTLFLPALKFHGENYYALFYRSKIAYAQNLAPSLGEYLAYAKLVATLATIPLLSAAALAASLVGPRRSEFTATDRSFAKLFLCLFISILGPLSLFKIKFPHYALPAYPFLALLAAFVPHRYWGSRMVPTYVFRLSIAVALMLVALPIKVTGKRSKDTLNLVNAIKLDARIREKPVYFRGDFLEDMGIYQHFKFYGGIDLRYAEPQSLDAVDLKNGYLIVKNARLPINHRGRKLGTESCFFINSEFCAFTESNPSFRLPDRDFPEEIY